MNILVTGGAGYIGSHIIVELLNRGDNIISIDDLSKSSGILNNGIKEITGRDFNFHQFNLADKSKLSKVFAENNIDSVIHFTAHKSVGESDDMPLKYYRNNIDSLLTLLEVMDEYNVTKIIFSSSCTVYDEASSPITEETPAGKGINPYGWSKVFCEQILNNASIANPELEITLLRYFNPIGNHPSALIGEDTDDIPQNLLPYISKVADGKLDKLIVHGDNYTTVDGTCVRDYIHVVDLAGAHVAALDKIKPGVTNSLQPRIR